MSRRRTDIDRLWYSSDIKSSFGLGSSSHREDFTPGTLKAFQVALVEPVAYLEDSVTKFGDGVQIGFLSGFGQTANDHVLGHFGA